MQRGGIVMVSKDYANKVGSTKETQGAKAKKTHENDFVQGQGKKFTSTKRQFGGVKRK